jgi:DNA-binding cell septation regulator SpoVG
MLRKIFFGRLVPMERGAMKEPQITVQIRRSGKPGSTKAYADVLLHFPDGEIRLIGFGIVKQPGKSPWVGFPENHGQNKYFPVVEAKGRIRDGIVKAVLAAYSESESEWGS